MSRIIQLLMRVVVIVGACNLPPAVSPALATELVPADTAEIVDWSLRAVVAECVRSEARMVEKYGGNIFTFSEFRRVEPIYGKIGHTFTLRLFGGQVGDTVVDAPLMPRFRAGERVVLFLGKDNADGHPLVDPQGVYQISSNRKNDNELLVVTPIVNLPLFRAEDGRRYEDHDPGLQVPLSDFVYSLRKAKLGLQ